MKKLLFLAFLLPTIAQAADNAVVLTPGSGVTMRSIDIGGGVQSTVNILGGPTGASIYGTAGSSNAIVLSVQGIASGTALPISGTVTVTGVATAVNQTSIIGTKAAGTAAASSLLTGGVYNSGGITLTDGQQSAAQFDASGNLKVSGVGVAQNSTTSGQTGSLVMGAVTTAAPTYTTAQTSSLSLTTAGDLRTVFSNTTIAATQSGTWTVQPGNTANTTAWITNTNSPYPIGSTPLTASATGTTGATTATLAGTSGKTTYICGYSIRANATAATTVTNTITGIITATLSSIMWIAPLASGIGLDEMIFSPCIPASGTNQAIAVVSGAPGSGGTVSSKGWGYQL